MVQTKFRQTDVWMDAHTHAHMPKCCSDDYISLTASGLDKK